MNLNKLPTIDWEAVQISVRRIVLDPHTYRTLTFIAAGVLLLACWLFNLPVWGGTPAPTITATATPFESTHIPTRTVTPTWTITPSKTATARPLTYTSTATFTVNTSTAIPSPSSIPSATRIPAGRDTLPRTGMSEQEIAELTPTITATVEPTPTATPLTLPDGCKFHSLLIESDKDYTELTFRCPNGEKTAESVGD
jgi:hypothetical protein